MPYHRRYRSLLGDAFDVYLAILRIVDKRVKHALKHDTPDWRVRNACPPCTYRLEGEPSRAFNRIVAFDGNNSMKRLYQVGAARVRDMRAFTDTDYLLPPEYVDKFKDEVASHRGPTVPDTSPDISGNASSYNQPECTDRWKAAAADEKKAMWGIFEETGWFVSACRHSLILWFADMIHSGELYVPSAGLF